jgi:ribosomal protein S4
MDDFVNASPYRQLVEFHRRTGLQAAHTGLNGWANMQTLAVHEKQFREHRALIVRRKRYALLKLQQVANKLQQMVEGESRLLSNTEQMAVAIRSLERKEKTNE